MSYPPRIRPTVLPLTESNGAPRHTDDKQKRLIQQAVTSALDERDDKLLRKVEALTERLETGMTRLMSVVEGFASGDRDTAVAHLTDGPGDDLPSVSFLKTEPSLIYTYSTTDIADQLGVDWHDISYLLNNHGLAWVETKPDLWDAKTYSKTNRRLWHPNAVKLLREVITNEEHDERAHISAGCSRVLARCAKTS